MKLITNLLLIITTLILTGCASNKPVDDNRAGCTKIDGKARYGTLTQYAKGKADGIYVYVGDKVKGKVKIKCNETTQEILYGYETDEIATEGETWRSLDNEVIVFED